MHLLQTNNRYFEIRTLADGIFRIRMSRDGSFRETLLNRYNIIEEPKEDIENTIQKDEQIKITAGSHTVCIENEGHLTFSAAGYELTIMPGAPQENGFSLTIPLKNGERLYGTGDENRESLNKRGRTATLWQANVITYGPIPYLMSSQGWGILVNSTYKQVFDLGDTDPDVVQIEVESGTLDVYVFLADSMINTLELYTRITGRPLVLPRAAYGFTSVCNEELGARELLDDCVRYRREDIPCDIMGLEPGWMETHYDFSVNKKWKLEKFHYPTEGTPAYTGSSSFFFNLRKMGYKLSLWLCCDYDLLWEEEKTSLFITRNSFDGAAFTDEHFGYNTLMDKVTKQGEPWFEHLKKFVDNGAFAFKLDGANQVLEHPDRLWACRYTDDEVHNIYPVIYAKQMKEGFTDYTHGRRAMIYTPALFVGTQKYAATWAGDTGGGQKTLVSILNLALCGHTNASCDLNAARPLCMHYSFLMPWTQYLGWRNWMLPWYLGDENEAMWRRYAKLRSSLFPYIYSMAHKAAQCGLPIARPLCLMYPEEESLVDAVNMYMFGDSLLVGAFDMNLCLPHGKWLDLLTGDVVEGGKPFYYNIPEGYGGALFAKAGSVWITQQPKPYLDAPIPSEYTIHVFPGCDCSFSLIEDDGVTYRYLDGDYAATEVCMTNSTETAFELTISRRRGGYTVENKVPYDIIDMSENAIENIRPLPEVTGFDVAVYLEHAPKSVTAQGHKVATTYSEGVLRFRLEKEAHEKTDVTFTVIIS